MYRNFIKPLCDASVALVALIMSLPIMLFLFVVTAIVLKGNPIFKQKRAGKGRKIFNILKFRSMSNASDLNGNLLPDGERLNAYGIFLRKSSLDELPQLLNILIGQMSFVGPRPLPVEYLELYTKNQNKRHLVAAGITGWAQVNGRNAMTWKKKFEHDVWYVERQSFLLDLRILFLTVRKVLISEGINTKGFITTEKFYGTDEGS